MPATIKEIEEQYPKKDWGFIRCQQVSCKVQMTTVLIFDTPEEEDEFYNKKIEEQLHFRKRLVTALHYSFAGNCGCKTGAPGSRWRKQKIKMLTKAFDYSDEKANKIYSAIEDACKEIGSFDAGNEELYLEISEKILWGESIELEEILDVLRLEIGFVYTGEVGSRLLIDPNRSSHLPYHHYKPVKGSWSNP